MYIKFNYKETWFFYGPWTEVSVQYGCQRTPIPEYPMTLSDSYGQFVADEIFPQPLSGEDEMKAGYTVIAGTDKDGVRKSIALFRCSAYLLAENGSTIEKIAN